MSVRIDLLALLHRERKRKRRKFLYIVCGVGGIILLLFSLTMEKIYRIHTLKKEIARIDEEAEQLQVVLQKIEELKEEEAKIKKRLAVIEELVKGKFLWTKIMDEISAALPYGAWLSRITCEKEEELNIEGVAFTNFSIATFAEALERNNEFTEVRIKTVEETKIEEETLKRFLIGCKIRR